MAAIRRTVVLLFGPPGAGKSTLARELAAAHGLEVFDRDDLRWMQSEARFRSALRMVAADGSARAVVIRSGATSTARAKAARLVGATHGYLLNPGLDECVARVRSRRRADAHAGVRGIGAWYRDADFVDRVPEWSGSVGPAWTPLRLPGRSPSPAVRRAKYGAGHRRQRQRFAALLPLPCTVCGRAVLPDQPWDLDHTDDGTGYLGPAHPSCNRAKGARKTNKQRARDSQRAIASTTHRLTL